MTTRPSPLLETPSIPLSEPPADEPMVHAVTETGGSSPSAVRAAEAALILRHTHLKDALPKLEAAATKAKMELSSAKAEMGDIVRLLAAHKRLREPVRRKR